MPSTQLARGLWTGFASSENPFQSPNGMPENLRTLDDHMAPYTLAAPLPAGSPFPSGAQDGDGQIYDDGTYAVLNAGVWKIYAARKGITVMQQDGSEVWQGTGTGWRKASVLDVQPAIDAAQEAVRYLALQAADSAAAVLTQGNSFTRKACAGTQRAPIFAWTTSIGEGANSSIWHRDSYTAIIRRALQVRFGNTNYGFANFNTRIYDVYPSETKYPHYVTHPNSVVTGDSFQNQMFGGIGARLPNVGDYIDVQYVGKDAVLVYQRDQASGARLEVLLDDALVGYIDTKTNVDLFGASLPNASFSIPIEVPSFGPHKIRLINTDGGTALLSGMVYLDNVNDLGAPVFMACGRSSSTLADTPDDMLNLYATAGSALILEQGVNDDLLGKDITVFRAKLNYVLAACRAAGNPAIVVDTIFSKPADNIYKTALKEAAATYGFTYLDFGAIWSRDMATNKSLRYLDADGVHPTNAGHKSIAQSILAWMGLSYVDWPPPSTCRPRLQNGWIDYGQDGYDGASMHRDRDTVTLGGMIRSGSTAADTVIFQLPQGWRPVGRLQFSAPSGGGTGVIEVLPTGDVRVGAGISASYVSISNISFRAALL